MREKRQKRQGTEATKETEATPALATGSRERWAPEGALSSRERGAKAWLLASLWSLLSLASLPLTAATGSSPEFRLDLRGLGPWQRHTARASEPLAFSSSWATNAAAGAKAVVKVMPVLKTKPKYLVIDLSGGTSATHYPISYLDEVPGGSWSDEYKTSKLVLRHIPAGSFIMGGRATDYPGAVNTNLHMVTITRDFYMGVFEVTQRQWELVMGNRPSAFTNQTYYMTRPVDSISWTDVRGTQEGTMWPKEKYVDQDSFLGCVNRRTGIAGFDLPTDEQWEYACRAGETTFWYKKSPWVQGEFTLGQIYYNSGWGDLSAEVQNNIVGCLVSDNQLSDFWLAANEIRNVGTASVGSYAPNNYDLYDLYGNVCEMCLDRASDVVGVDGQVAPCSADDILRVTRSGAFLHDDYAGCNSVKKSSVGQTSKRVFDLGFRLCLQGGDVPDFAAASTLVNESGAGSQSWTPTRSGAYYLTHSTMNGEANAQLMSAWFEVPGCELSLEPQGELTNGVSVAITGAGEGWTVYYTTNGLAPSQASEKYTGPFSLPESATVRAVAYNAQGVASEEATTTFTLHDALSVVGAVARQRYPWNGMVDIDCAITGDPEAKYEVELAVKDLEGGTNIVARTVGAARRRGPQSQNNETALNDDYGALGDRALPPGTYRLTWNADKDIAYDHDFPRVAVTVKATKQSVLAGYARQFAISTDGYAGEETLTGVPVLVRLSSAIDGFDYRDFASPSNGADLVFFDANEQTLPYEIDEWHTNGESLVWVKLPTLKKGTRFTCAYGNVDAESSPCQKEDVSNSIGRGEDTASTGRTRMKHEVWREYAGVWHMNEDSGTAFDSTEHGLDALPSCGVNGNIQEMVSYLNGVCGKGRVNSSTKTVAGNFMSVPSYDALKMGSCFTASAWLRLTDVNEYQKLFYRKTIGTDLDGWHVYFSQNSEHLLSMAGASRSGCYFQIPSALQSWVYTVVVYDGSQGTAYSNGVMSVTGIITPATESGQPLCIGGCASQSASLYGQYDEIRLRGGSLSADRIKADYDMIANQAFCTYGAVKKGAGE